MVATPAEWTAPPVTGWAVTVELVGSVAAPITLLAGLIAEGAGALDGLEVSVGADAMEDVPLDGAEIGLAELVFVSDEPTVEGPVEPGLLAGGELGELAELPLELLGMVEPAVEPTVLELPVAVLAMPFEGAAESLAGLLIELEPAGCAVPVELTVAG